MAPKPTTQRELLGSLFKKPGFRRAFNKRKVFSDLLVEVINRRIQLGMTQSDLAKAVGTYQSAISRIEAGNQNVTLETISEIADALDAYLDLRLVPYLETEVFEVHFWATSSSEDPGYSVKVTSAEEPVQWQ